MAPDNGLLAQLLDNCAEPRVYKLNISKLDALSLPVPSATFHGRDIFAPIAAELAAGRITAQDMGAETNANGNLKAEARKDAASMVDVIVKRDESAMVLRADSTVRQLDVLKLNLRRVREWLHLYKIFLRKSESMYA